MALDEQQRRLAEELLFSEEKKPSFAKMLYFGLFDGATVFPPPRVECEEKQRVADFVKKVQEFADQHIDAKKIDKEAAIPDSLIKSLGDLGLLGLTIPSEYGGLGMSQYGYCKAMEVLARKCASTALFVNAHQSVGLKALLLFGTEEQRKRWLPPLAKGEHIAAFSLTEPNAGSDASGIETRAVYDSEKQVYRINGKKQWTTNGSIAKMLTVMARTEVDTPQGKQDKITAFLVTPDMPGFRVTAHALEKVGMRGTKTANLEFCDLEVPQENILGSFGGGLKVCLTVLDYGRTTFGATCTGAAKMLLEQAVDYSKTRYQFKRPLASFALVKKKIATMAALVYAMDATTYLTAGLVDSDVEDFMLEAAMLKVFASDSLWTIVYETMQIFGGKSFFTDLPLERMMRDARINMIGEGANEVMRAFIGLVGMRDVGMQLKGIVDALWHPLTHFRRFSHFGKHFLRRAKAPHIPVRAVILHPEAKRLSKVVRRFGFVIIRLLARYREDVMEKQLALDRIATSAMAIYTTTAVLSKLDHDLAEAQKSSQALENDIAIAKFYCHCAMDCVDRCLDTLFRKNRDMEIEALSNQITGIHSS